MADDESKYRKGMRKGMVNSEKELTELEAKLKKVYVLRVDNMEKLHKAELEKRDKETEAFLKKKDEAYNKLLKQVEEARIAVKDAEVYYNTESERLRHFLVDSGSIVREANARYETVIKDLALAKSTKDLLDALLAAYGRMTQAALKKVPRNVKNIKQIQEA